MLSADQAIGQFWKELASIVTVKCCQSGRVEHWCINIQRDHSLLQ